MGLFGCGSDESGGDDGLHCHAGDPELHLDVDCHDDHVHALVECTSQSACLGAMNFLLPATPGCEGAPPYENCPVSLLSCNATMNGEVPSNKLKWDPNVTCPGDCTAATTALLDFEADWVKACQGTSQKAEAGVEMV